VRRTSWAALGILVVGCGRRPAPERELIAEDFCGVVQACADDHSYPMDRDECVDSIEDAHAAAQEDCAGPFDDHMRCLLSEGTCTSGYYTASCSQTLTALASCGAATLPPKPSTPDLRALESVVWLWCEGAIRCPPEDNDYGGNSRTCRNDVEGGLSDAVERGCAQPFAQLLGCLSQELPCDYDAYEACGTESAAYNTCMYY